MKDVITVSRECDGKTTTAIAIWKNPRWICCLKIPGANKVYSQPGDDIYFLLADMLENERRNEKCRPDTANQ